MVNKGPIDATSYEQRLNLDPTLALREGSMHFEGESAVHATMRRLAERLERLEIPYAVVGGMAMFLHGYRRFTEDVGVLVTQQDLDTIHQQLDGLGYVRIVDGGRNLRDAELGVRVEFLVTGQFPGDGKSKPIAFPSPEENVTVIDGIRCLGLPQMVQLKLASGTAKGRRRDPGRRAGHDPPA
jgi:hypothetical protein